MCLRCNLLLNVESLRWLELLPPLGYLTLQDPSTWLIALAASVPGANMVVQMLQFTCDLLDNVFYMIWFSSWEMFWADGQYLIEIDRILRPGGYWILSGPPINWETHWKGWNRTREDLRAEQSQIERVAKSLCWRKLVQRNDIAIWQKPTNHVHCKVNRKVFKRPLFCKSQNPDMAW
jgi:hypothetical protein